MEVRTELGTVAGSGLCVPEDCGAMKASAPPRANGHSDAVIKMTNEAYRLSR